MYAKVFAQIFDSSIADDFRLRHFFMDMIVLADINGVVDMTPSAIAARTRIPLENVVSMLATLESPDPESRTADADGKRIERLDEHRTWGWHIINYAKFRQTASEEQRREKTRIRVANFKAKRQQNDTGNAPVTHGNAPVTHGNAPVTHGNAPVTHGNAGNAMQRQREMQKEEAFVPTMPDAEKWLAEWIKCGADYTLDETKSAFLALSANGWMWGKNPVTDYRAALERQIQTDRQRASPKIYDRTISKPNPRNIGVAKAGRSYGDAARAKQQQQERERLAEEMAAAGHNEEPATG